MSVTAERAGGAVSMVGSEVDNESSPSQNRTEEHFVYHRLFRCRGGGSAVRDADRACYGAKIYGVHVNQFENYLVAGPEAVTAMTGPIEEETMEDTRRLNKQLKGVEHEVIVVEGNVGQTVSGLIQDKEFDLVVVGTRGRTGFGKALLGSTAEQILRQVPCPVLTVGPYVTREPEKAAKMREILYATDLSVNSPAATPYAFSLAQENQANLTLLHVLAEAQTGDLVQPEQVVGTLERKLKHWFRRELSCGANRHASLNKGRRRKRF